ncbi:MAG: hypothetical protein HY719_14925 [Planctomycetes bacterium]|nr:hypothetical protein [Planctomycetota bacterium]
MRLSATLARVASLSGFAAALLAAASAGAQEAPARPPTPAPVAPPSASAPGATAAPAPTAPAAAPTPVPTTPAVAPAPPSSAPVAPAAERRQYDPPAGTREWTGETPEAEKADPNIYVGGLNGRAHATVYDAYRVTYMLLSGRAAYVPFHKLRGYLIRKEVLVRGWIERQPDERVTSGDVAFLISRAVDVRGGLLMRLTDLIGLPTKRYSFRECTFKGIVPGENPREFMGGAELVTVLSKATEYQERQALLAAGAEKSATERFEEEARERFTKEVGEDTK